MQKICPKCGLQIEFGLAQCQGCGTQVGTVFSEEHIPKEDTRAKVRQKKSAQMQYFQKIDKAQERANNSVILSLASFFCPGLGFIMCAISVFWGIDASRTLKDANVEEGQGAAAAGAIIGVIAFIAQICYVLYVAKMGLPFS